MSNYQNKNLNWWLATARCNRNVTRQRSQKSGYEVHFNWIFRKILTARSGQMTTFMCTWNEITVTEGDLWPFFTVMTTHNFTHHLTKCTRIYLKYNFVYTKFESIYTAFTWRFWISLLFKIYSILISYFFKLSLEKILKI